MSGEMRVVKTALLWGALAAIPVSLAASIVRGRAGGITALVAVAIVLGNTGLSALLSAFAGRVNQFGAAMIALPSFAIRMALIAAVLVVLDHAAFVDKPVFALTFGVAITATLVLEARSMKRTPWLALNFGPKER